MFSLERQREFAKNIAKQVEDPVLRQSLENAVEERGFLPQTLAVAELTIDNANKLLGPAFGLDPDLDATKKTHDILESLGKDRLPNPFEPLQLQTLEERVVWAKTARQTVRRGNNEIKAKIYTSPATILEKSRREQPWKDVFDWYLWDFLGRLTAAYLGISNTDRAQELAADQITGCLAESLVISAETGMMPERAIVCDLTRAGFIGPNFVFSDNLVQRADKLVRIDTTVRELLSRKRS